MEHLIDPHKLTNSLHVLFPSRLPQKIREALFVMRIDEHNIQVVPFLEFQQDVCAVFGGKKHGFWGLAVLLVAHLADVLLGGEVFGLFGEVHAEGWDFVLGLEEGCDVLEAGIGQAD